jgi:hypothetical protein
MNKTLAKRIERLMPGGIPRYIRCYDNGGESFDQYTVVFTGNYNLIGKKKVRGHYYGRKSYFYVGMSEHPFSPSGFGQHGESDFIIDKPTYSHLGKKITFDKLPEDCKKLVISDYKDLWELTEVGINEQGILDIVDKD